MNGNQHGASYRVDDSGASLRPDSDAAAAAVGSLSCSTTDGSIATRSTSSVGHSGGSAVSDENHFSGRVLAHAEAGHRGLEAALQLLCERLLDLEGCWEKAQVVSAQPTFRVHFPSYVSIPSTHNTAMPPYHRLPRSTSPRR